MALTGTQKFCLWLVILGSLALIAGSAAPFWILLEGRVSKTALGPWYYCVDTVVTDNECHTYDWGNLSFGDYNVWFYVFHAAEGLATLMSLMLVLIALLKVCGDGDSAKGPAGVGLIAGLLGIGAAVLFYVKTSDSLKFPVSQDDHDWAFIVFSSGTGLLTFFSIVLLALPNARATMVGPY